MAMLMALSAFSDSRPSSDFPLWMFPPGLWNGVWLAKHAATSTIVGGVRGRTDTGSIAIVNTSNISRNVVLRSRSGRIIRSLEASCKNPTGLARISDRVPFSCVYQLATHCEDQSEVKGRKAVREAEAFGIDFPPKIMHAFDTTLGLILR